MPKLLAGTAAVMKREGGGWNTTVPTSTRRTISSCETLVVDLDVVVAGVVALGVEVHVHVDPLAEQAARADVHLVVEARGLEAAATAGIRVERQRRGTPFLANAVGPDLESGLAVQGQVGVLRGEPEDVLSGRLPFLLAGERQIGDPVEISESEARAARSARSAATVGGDHAVERRQPEAGRQTRATHPGGSERGWLLESERGLLEADPEPERRRIRLRAEHPRQPDQAAQGDQETCHSRGSRRGLRMMDHANIMPGTTPYNRMS